MTTVPDWLAVLGLVVPAGTGLAGYVLAGRNEQSRDERTAKREAIARRASVRERLEEERHAFQRETLLELQDALQRFVRCTARVIFHDQDTLKQQGTLTQLDEELNNETYKVGVTVRRLQERVLDATLRAEVEQFRGRVSGIEASFVLIKDMSAVDGIEHLKVQLAEMTSHYIALNNQLGAALRGELGWLPEEPE